MADTKAKEATISIKVIVDKVNKKVVYAEADHSFVDILFSFMTLPMGTIVRLLGKLDDNNFEALGSLNNLYQSLKDFPECYLSTEECKCLLLNPRSLLYDNCRNLKLKIDDTNPMTYLVCKNSLCPSVGKPKVYNAFCNICAFKRCYKCEKLMGVKELFRNTDNCVGGGVFVSDIATFIITDDLHVEPYSSAISIELLADLGITDMNHLEEGTLEMSSSQMVYFLNLALTTDCPFTYLVFSKINSSRSIVGSIQDNISDQSCDLMEKKSCSKMLLEVTRQKSTKKLLFAEAKEDFVEFLFGILSIPLGTVIGTLMKGTSSLTCMDNILKSISNMSVGRYFKSQDIKDMLLEPHIGQQYNSFENQVFSLNVLPTPICEHFNKGPPWLDIEGILKQSGPFINLYDGPGLNSGFLKQSRLSIDLYEGPELNPGFLKQSGLFILTDDLTITTSTSFSTIDILKKFKVSPKDIERCDVSIGLEEGLRILKASLKSRLTLTESLKYQLKK